MRLHSPFAPFARRCISIFAAAVAAFLVSSHATLHAQQPASPPAAPAPNAPPAAAPAPAPPPQYQPSGEWNKLPKMQLERQFSGPLQDTIVQRLRDTDGTICYLYLPISVQHSPVSSNGFVQYGPNTIGSISCMPAPAAARR